MIRRILDAFAYKAEDPIKKDLETLPIDQLQGYCDQHGLTLRVKPDFTKLAVEVRRTKTDEGPLFKKEIPRSEKMRYLDFSLRPEWEAKPTPFHTQEIRGYVILKVLPKKEEHASNKERWIAQLREIIKDYLPRERTFHGYGDGESLDKIRRHLTECIEKPYQNLVEVGALFSHLPFSGDHPIILMGRLCRLIERYPVITRGEDTEKFRSNGTWFKLNSHIEEAWLTRRTAEHLARRTVFTSEQRVDLFAENPAIQENGSAEDFGLTDPGRFFYLPNAEQCKVLDEVAKDVRADINELGSEIERQLTELMRKAKIEQKSDPQQEKPRGPSYR